METDSAEVIIRPVRRGSLEDAAGVAEVLNSIIADELFMELFFEEHEP